MKDNTGHQLLMISDALKQDQRNYLHEVEQWKARIAELEAVLADVADTSSSSRLRRLAKQALNKKELSE